MRRLGRRWVVVWVFALSLAVFMAPVSRASESGTFGPVEQVTLTADGSLPNDSSLGFSVSVDGRFVAFGSYASNLVPGDTNNYQDVFVRDRQSHTTERVSVSSDGSQGYPRTMNNVGMYPAISADGRFVAFSSMADLVGGLEYQGPDIFLRDRLTQTTELISISRWAAREWLELVSRHFGGWAIRCLFVGGQ